MTKTCTQCGEAKTLDQFGPLKLGRGGLRPTCKPCHSLATARGNKERMSDPNRRGPALEKKKQWKEAKADCPEFRAQVFAQRQRHNLRKYGLTPAGKEQILEGQGHRCASCEDPLEPGKHTHIDHCHDTGRVRAILCHYCNTALGLLRDDPERIMRLHAYAVRVCVPLKPEPHVG